MWFHNTGKHESVGDLGFYNTGKHESVGDLGCTCGSMILSTSDEIKPDEFSS